MIEGEVAPDPSKALAAATQAFEKVGGTLQSIDAAANGIARMTKSADKIPAFLATWDTAGQRITAAADGIDRFIRANEADFRPAVANLREVTGKLNTDARPADPGRPEVGRPAVRHRLGQAERGPGQRRAAVQGPRRAGQLASPRPTSARPSAG